MERITNVKGSLTLGLVIVSVLGCSFPNLALAQTAPTPNPSYQSLFSVGRGNNKVTVPNAQSVASYFLTTSGNQNGQVAKGDRQIVSIGSGTLANGTTFTYELALGRAATITQISIAASTVPVGGTNTVTVKKNGTTNLLSAANFDPTTIAAAQTSQVLPLSATAASLSLAATDTIDVVYTSGTQATAAIAPVITIEALLTDY